MSLPIPNDWQNLPQPNTLIVMDFDANLSEASQSAGNVSSSALAAMDGPQGLLVTLPGNTTESYVRREIPHYDYAYFETLFDPNSVSMANNTNHVFMLVRNAAQWLGYIRFGYTTTSGYSLQLICDPDSGGADVVSGVYTLTDKQHIIGFEYQRASGVGANDGYINLFVDGVEALSLTDLDNDLYYIDNLYLGALVGVDSSTSGAYYIDRVRVYDARPAHYCQMTLTVPNSPMWRAMTRGAVYSLAFAWKWDKQTGDQAEAAEIALAMFDSIIISDCT